MMQTIVTVLIVAMAAAWIARHIWRFWHPPKKGCAGSCCSHGSGTGPEPEAAIPPKAGGEVMILSNDLRARVKARR